MNLTITAQLGAKSAQNKGLEILDSKHLKTRTDLSVVVEGKDVPNFLEAEEDISLLKLEGAPVLGVSVMVVDVKSLGKLINRSVLSMLKACIQIGEGEETPMGWDDTSGVFSVNGSGGVPLSGSDIPYLFEFLYRMMRRANTVMSGTQHPLTLFDLKQATGITYGVKAGDEDAIALDQWFAPRELVALEEKKAAAKIKAKARSEAKVKVKAKLGKSKPKPKAKAKTKANLGNMT